MRAARELSIDLNAIRDDDQLIEDLRAGAVPPNSDKIAGMLADWQDEVHGRGDPYRRLLNRGRAATSQAGHATA